jgi:hypothetical protein
MDLWDVISSVGEEGADQSWWEALTGLNTGIDWEGLFSGIDLSGIDLTNLWGSGDIDLSPGTSYDTGEGLPGEEAAAGSQGGGGGTGNIIVGGGGSSYETGEGLPGEEAAAGSQGGSGGTGNIIPPTDKLKGLAKTFGLTDEAGKINPAALLGLTALLSMAGQGSRGTPAPSGYQGTVPKLTAVRERVAIPEDPNRRPGAGGRRYFSDVSFAAPGATPADTQAAVDAARTAAKTQAATLKPALYPVPQVKAPEVKTPEPTPTPAPAPAPSYASGVAALEPVPKYDERGDVIGLTSLPPKVKTAFQEPPNDFSLIPVQPRREPLNLPVSAARGGLMGLAKGRYLSGPTDGMEDKVPATIAGKQPARLSHGEFVIPADVVGHLGNGNSEAGAKRLYDMMDRVRKARTGTPKQGKQINPNKYLPK